MRINYFFIALWLMIWSFQLQAIEVDLTSPLAVKVNGQEISEELWKGRYAQNLQPKDFLLLPTGVYEVQQKLGQGSMGAAYRVKKTSGTVEKVELFKAFFGGFSGHSAVDEAKQLRLLAKKEIPVPEVKFVDPSLKSRWILKEYLDGVTTESLMNSVTDLKQVLYYVQSTNRLLEKIDLGNEVIGDIHWKNTMFIPATGKTILFDPGPVYSAKEPLQKMHYNDYRARYYTRNQQWLLADALDNVFMSQLKLPHSFLFKAILQENALLKNFHAKAHPEVGVDFLEYLNKKLDGNLLAKESLKKWVKEFPWEDAFQFNGVLKQNVLASIPLTQPKRLDGGLDLLLYPMYYACLSDSHCKKSAALHWVTPFEMREAKVSSKFSQCFRFLLQ